MIRSVSESGGITYQSPQRGANLVHVGLKLAQALHLHIQLMIDVLDLVVDDGKRGQPVARHQGSRCARLSDRPLAPVAPVVPLDPVAPVAPTKPCLPTAPDGPGGPGMPRSPRAPRCIEFRSRRLLAIDGILA